MAHPVITRADEEALHPPDLPSKPGVLPPVAGLDHKVGDRIGGRVDDQTAHLDPQAR